ncbi:YciI family protein [Stieleria sp. TO1_6]|uniref:YciI family protein n=1 Tax=Stieleria tagensis TaxID=2956795 RepID=UPI00209ABC40|nr:YciI family protein [Stieleria tagensis]MCO8123750.1 YciI family protein [Stieleria tagensis]
MKVMVLVKANDDSEAGRMPSEQLLTEMGNFNQALAEAGVMRSGEGLHPTSKAKRVACDGHQRVVTDGPFAETKELIAGFWIWEVASMDEAVDWVKKSPFQAGEIEIRPVFEAEDFGEEFTPELRQQEARVFAHAMLNGSTTQPYLFFAGRCEEALEFYKQALGANVQMMMRFSDSPDPLPEGMLQNGFENKVMHATFTIGSMTLMGSDGCNDATRFSGFRLALTVPDENAAHHALDALAAGGTIDMPLQKTFWSPCYGQVTDKFGLGWMVMVAGPTA